MTTHRTAQETKSEKCYAMMELASDTVIDAAYAWVCRQRRDWPADTDIWDLRFRWGKDKQQIQSDLERGEYRFAPMDRVTKTNGEVVHVWGSRDALVLKALSIVLAKILPVSDRCSHVKGHGGAKAAVRAVASHMGQHSFVMRTDVKAYYDSIDQTSTACWKCSPLMSQTAGC